MDEIIKNFLKELPWWANLIVIIVCLGFFFGLFCLNSWILMLVWNWVIPTIFALTTITFWQAFGLKLLCMCFIGTKINWNSKNDN